MQFISRVDRNAFQRKSFRRFVFCGEAWLGLTTIEQLTLTRLMVLPVGVIFVRGQKQNDVALFVFDRDNVDQAIECSSWGLKSGSSEISLGIAYGTYKNERYEVESKIAGIGSAAVTAIFPGERGIPSSKCAILNDKSRILQLWHRKWKNSFQRQNKLPRRNIFLIATLWQQHRKRLKFLHVNMN